MDFIVQREPYLVKSRLVRQEPKADRLVQQVKHQIVQAVPMDLIAKRAQARPHKKSVPSTLGVLAQNSGMDVHSERVRQE